MIDADRLDELSTYTTEEDTPDDARVALPWRDLRDLVALIPVVRAELTYRDDPHPARFEAIDDALDALLERS